MKISGHMYWPVPNTVPVISSAFFANPKSPILYTFLIHHLPFPSHHSLSIYLSILYLGVSTPNDELLTILSKYGSRWEWPMKEWRQNFSAVAGNHRDCLHRSSRISCNRIGSLQWLRILSRHVGYWYSWGSLLMKGEVSRVWVFFWRRRGENGNPRRERRWHRCLCLNFWERYNLGSC